jgi:hypothetical protein
MAATSAFVIMDKRLPKFRDRMRRLGRLDEVIELALV